MARKKPATVYKYCPPARLDVLQSCKVAFTRASVMNDILEMKPVPILNTDLYEQDQAEFRRLTPHLPHPYISPPTLDDEIKTRDSVLSTVFCLCVSECWDISLMWSYYADSHRGMVIGFDSTESSLFGTEFQEVRYEKERPTAEHPTQPQGYYKSIFTKANFWGHEYEWRSVRLLSDITEAPELEETAPRGDIWLTKYPPSAVKEVLIGNRTAPCLAKKIVQLLSQPQFSHVKLYQALPSATTWELDRVELSADDKSRLLQSECSTDCRCRPTPLERSHDELRAALILAGRRIVKLNFGRRQDQVLAVLRRVLREARQIRRSSR